MIWGLIGKHGGIYVGIVYLTLFIVWFILGSFLNVVAYRLPRHESLVSPPSHCPACDAPVRPYDNIPILSWMILRAKCRGCGTKISARYPFVEALAGVLFLALWLHGH